MSESDRNELPRLLYPIKNDSYHYYTGHLNNGNQVLMDDAHRLEFDTDGNLIATFGRETSQTTLTPSSIDGKVLAVFTLLGSNAPMLASLGVSMTLPFVLS